MIPILALLLLCLQVDVRVSPSTTRTTDIIDAMPYAATVTANMAVYEARKFRAWLRGFKTPPKNINIRLRWNQFVFRKGKTLSIGAPLILRKEAGHWAARIAVVAMAGFLVQAYPWAHLAFPMALGMTAWVDGNTQAAPTAEDMDGAGTDLATGDSVNITKALVIDKSVGCGNLTAPTVTLNTSKTLTMDAGSTFTTTTAFNLYGTVVFGDATVSCTGTGGAIEGTSVCIDGGVWNGGTGANHTIGSLSATSNPHSITFTSGNTIFNSVGISYTNLTWHINANMTFANSNGTVKFTRAGAQLMYRNASTLLTLHNLAVDNASCVLSYYFPGPFPIKVDNNLSISAGRFNTWDGSVSATITVNWLTTVAGTLDCKGSTMVLGSGRTSTFWAVEVTGVFIGGSGAHTLGNLGVKAGGNCTLTSGTTIVDSGRDSYETILVEGGATFSHGSGNLSTTCTFAAGQITWGLDTLAFNNWTLTMGVGKKLYFVGGNRTLRVAGNLTITSGAIDTWSSQTNGLTVTNSTIIDTNGSLICNGGAISLGSGLNWNTPSCKVTGTFTGGSGAHTIGCLWINGATASYTATSGITALNNAIGTYVIYKDNVGSTFAHGGGTIVDVAPVSSYINSNMTFNNFTMNSAGHILYMPYDTAGITTIAGNFTVMAGYIYDNATSPGAGIVVTGTTSITGSLLAASANHIMTFNSTVNINSGGVVGGVTGWSCDGNSSFNILAGGAFYAPTSAGSCRLKWLSNLGAFTNDGGTVIFDVSEGGLTANDNETVFYNLTFNAPGASQYLYNSAVTVQNVLTFNSAAIVSSAYRNQTITMGTLSAAGAIVNTSGWKGPVLGYAVTIQAASATYPAVCTGVDWHWDAYVNPGAIWNLKWLNYQIDAITGGAGCKVNWAGTMATRSWTTSLGDTLTMTDGLVITGVSVAATKYINLGTWTWGTCSISLVDLQWDTTTPGTGKTITFVGNMGVDGFIISATDSLIFTVAGGLITGNAMKNIDIYGTGNFSGTAGSVVTVTPISIFVGRGGSNITLSYVTINAATAAGVPMQFISGAAITHTIDHLTIIGPGGCGTVASTNANPITLTNSSISGASGSGWTQKDFIIYTGAIFQLSNCTYSSVGMQSTSGWLVSKDSSSNFTVYGILASSETPSAGYRAGNIAGTLTVRNADAYATAFNSSYTLAATCPATTATLAASTTLNAAGYLSVATAVTGASSTTSILTNTGAWRTTATITAVDIQSTFTTAGTAISVTLAGVNLDAIAVGALDLVQLSGYSTSSAGFSIAATGEFKVLVNGCVRFATASTCSGTLTVEGVLQLDNSMEVNSTGSHLGTIAGAGVVQGVGSSAPALYFHVLAAGSTVRLLNATLVYDLFGAAAAPVDGFNLELTTEADFRLEVQA